MNSYAFASSESFLLSSPSVFHGITAESDTSLWNYLSSLPLPLPLGNEGEQLKEEEHLAI